MQLLPKTVNEYIASDDPVLVYDAFIEAIYFRDLGITLGPNDDLEKIDKQGIKVIVPSQR
jgi:hypothetical protein